MAFLNVRGEVCSSSFLFLPQCLSQEMSPSLPYSITVTLVKIHNTCATPNTFIQQHVNHHDLLPLSLPFANQGQVNNPTLPHTPYVTQNSPPFMFSTNQTTDMYFLTSCMSDLCFQSSERRGSCGLSVRFASVKPLHGRVVFYRTEACPRFTFSTSEDSFGHICEGFRSPLEKCAGILSHSRPGHSEGDWMNWLFFNWYKLELWRINHAKKAS